VRSKGLIVAMDLSQLCDQIKLQLCVYRKECCANSSRVTIYVEEMDGWCVCVCPRNSMLYRYPGCLDLGTCQRATTCFLCTRHVLTTISTQPPQLSIKLSKPPVDGRKKIDVRQGQFMSVSTVHRNMA
jgi:hypothetical protein